MQATPAYFTLEQFRLAAYQTLGQRKDSLFELMEAAVAALGPATLVSASGGSLVPVFRRGWPSASDALAEGEVDADRGRQLVQTMALEQAAGDRPIWALDGIRLRRTHRRRPPARSARTATARPRASRRTGLSRPGSTSGWWRCRCRVPVGCCH